MFVDSFCSVTRRRGWRQGSALTSERPGPGRPSLTNRLPGPILAKPEPASASMPAAGGAAREAWLLVVVPEARPVTQGRRASRTAAPELHTRTSSPAVARRAAARCARNGARPPAPRHGATPIPVGRKKESRAAVAGG